MGERVDAFIRCKQVGADVRMELHMMKNTIMLRCKLGDVGGRGSRKNIEERIVK